MRGVLFAVLLEAALVVCWSSGFVGTRFANAYAPVYTILMWRSLVSGLLLLPLALLRGPRMHWPAVRAQMVFGTLAMAVYLGCYATAIGQGVPTGLVALITDMLPLVVAVLSWPVLGHALTPRQWLGTCIGLAGVMVASGINTPMADASWWAYLLPVAGTASFAYATLLQKGSVTNAMPIHQQLCIQCLTAAGFFTVWTALEGGPLLPLSTGFAGGIVWLVLLATFGAWSLYYLALREFSAARVTAVLYLSPPVTMVWAWVMFDEPLSWPMLAGLAISLAGIVLFSTAGKPATADEPA